MALAYITTTLLKRIEELRIYKGILSCPQPYFDPIKSKNF